METQWRIAVDIGSDDQPVGMIELFYSEFDSTLADSGFRIREKKVIETCAEHLRKILTLRERAVALGDIKHYFDFLLERTGVHFSIVDENFMVKFIDPQRQRQYGKPDLRKCYEYFFGRHEVCSDCSTMRAFRTKELIIESSANSQNCSQVGCVSTVPYRTEDKNWVCVQVGVDLSDASPAEEAFAHARKYIAETGATDSALQSPSRSDAEVVQEVKKDILANLEGIILPLIRRMRQHRKDIPYLDMLEKSFHDIAASFGRKIIGHLTPREVEICNMIRNGFSGREIADALQISFGTVEVHRNNIRKKMKLVNQNISLASYLKSL